jgi:hypothetical protein
MPDPAPASATPQDELAVALPTGTLTLSGVAPERIHALCDFAARANPKRGFLIVSRVLGRHLPTPPEALCTAADALAAALRAYMHSNISLPEWPEVYAQARAALAAYDGETGG